jgi:hypothetical protein
VVVISPFVIPFYFFHKWTNSPHNKPKINPRQLALISDLVVQESNEGVREEKEKVKEGRKLRIQSNSPLRLVFVGSIFILVSV